MTRADVIAQRNEFWQTAPAFGGREEVWQALKAVCESDDHELGRAILSSAGVRLVNGTLAVAYDELGNRYDLPPFCSSFPTNVLDNGQGSGEAPTAAPASATAAATDTPAASSGKPKAAEAVEVAGDLPPIKGDPIDISIRLSNGKNMIVPSGTKDPVRRLRLAVAKEAGVPAKRLRIMFIGRPVRDSAVVDVLDLQAKDIVQVMIFPEEMLA